MEIQVSATYDQDSKRYHRFVIDEGQAVIGSIYIPKNKEIPERVTILLKTKTEKEKWQGVYFKAFNMERLLNPKELASILNVKLGFATLCQSGRLYPVARENRQSMDWSEGEGKEAEELWGLRGIMQVVIRDGNLEVAIVIFRKMVAPEPLHLPVKVERAGLIRDLKRIWIAIGKTTEEGKRGAGEVDEENEKGKEILVS